MASTLAVWGIDVGRCALTAIKLRAEADGKVTILAHDYIEHAKILSQPDADEPALIAAALEKFLSRNDVSKDNIVVGVPGQNTLSRFTKLPPVAPKRIPDIVRYEADQQIPFDMDEVIWDYQTFQQEDLPDIEVGIFAMKRELIREHLLHFEQASIEPIAVQPTPLAVYNAAHFDGRLQDETTILLDIGAENTDLVIATANSLWTRTIPIGGNNCTEALIKSFKLSFSKAENLKRTAESSKYRRQIFQAMRPIFADLVQELQRSIGFYSSTHRDAKIQKVFAVGNAFKLPGLQKYLQQNLGLPVESPKTFDRATRSASGDEALTEHFLSFWAAYGLALQGADLAKINSSLLPTEIAKQVVWRKKRPAFAAAAACVVLAGGLIWFRQAADTSALASSSAGIENVRVRDEDAQRVIDNPDESLSDLAYAESIRQASDSLKNQLNKLSGEGEEERARTEDLIRVQRNKSLIPKIFQAVHDALPKSDAAISQAKTPAQYQQAVLSVPRGERKQIWIRKMDIQYMQDINGLIWPEPLNKVEPPYNDPMSDLPGIKLIITCVTPNQSARKFIEETFVATLKENGCQPGQEFYIDRVYLIEGTRVKPMDDRLGLSGFESLGVRGRAITSSGSELSESEKLDPVTNESTVEDWQFEIWADVILETCPMLEAPTGEDDTDGGE